MITAAGIDIAVAYANQKISDKLDADTYTANPKAKSGDLVANHMTAAAVSTAMAEVLGSAVKHQPLNVANTAANAIGAAIGTGIGSTFADQLDAHYQQAEKGVQYTKQARRHAASMRAPTAAEQHAPGARPVAKPKPAARAYNPYNDPEILKAEAVANMSVPSAGLDLSQDAVGKQQAIYNASAAQRQNWQVDHSVMGGLDRSWHYIKNRVKSYAHFYDNYIAPSMQGLATVASGPFPYSTSMSLAMNVGLPLATNVMNWPSTMAANYRNFVNMDANDKTFTIITGAYNNLEQVAIGLGSEGIGAVSKIGMFAVAAKTATAAKVIGTGKILGASKLAFAGMFGRTVDVGGENIAKTVRFTKLASGSRADVRALLKSGTLVLPAEQIDKILYNLGSGRMDNVTLKLMNTGDVRIIAERAGRTSGYQRMSLEVDQMGRTNKVVQTAFDDANKLVHQKPGQSKNNLYDVKKWNKNTY